MEQIARNVRRSCRSLLRVSFYAYLQFVQMTLKIEKNSAHILFAFVNLLSLRVGWVRQSSWFETTRGVLIFIHGAIIHTSCIEFIIFQWSLLALALRGREREK